MERTGASVIRITTDFETQSDVDLKKCGAWEYSIARTTRVMCLAFKSSEGAQTWLFEWETMSQRWDQLPFTFRTKWESWIRNDEVVFNAHNAFFEQCIYKNILVRRLGWPEIPIHKWRCTAVKAAACALPRNLADAGAVMRLTTQKDFEGHRVMVKLCKPTAAWNKWNKAALAVKSGARVGPKVRALASAEPPVKFWNPATAPDDFKTLYRYCVVDVKTEELLDLALPDLTKFEQLLWFVDQKINMHGIAVDIDLVKRISKIMAAESKVMNKELDILTMGLVSSGNARAAILDFMTLEGVDMPDLKAKTVEDFLENGKATGDAAAILKIRRALSKASTAKYATFLRRAASDGRVRDMLLFLAASTGRWGGKGVQPQNFPRGIIKDIFEAIDRIKTCSVDDLKMLYGENLMPLFSSVLRGMFVASPGQTMYVEDYSAIECRVTWWLAGYEAGLQMFREGQDPYWEMAKKIFKLDSKLKYDEKILQHQEWRQVGKAAVLGCGYQMGGKKFVSSAWDVYRAKVDLDMAKVAVTTYRDVHFPVTELWGNYEDACIAAVENPTKRYRVGKVKFFVKGRFLVLELPSGRPLYYCDPKVEFEPVYQYVDLHGETGYTGSLNVLRAVIEAGGEKNGQFDAKKFSYMAVNMKAKKEDCVIPKWTREKSYGGKIVENVVQAVSRDILAEAIVRADMVGFDVLMHSHDELVSEAPKNSGNAETYKKVIEELPKWAEGLPLKSGGWFGDRYKKG